MNVLAIFAHPDDETMMAGGTLALLARRDFAVHYICATRGEGGEVGEPALCTLEELGAVREAELACAVRALSGRSLSFLGYVDPRVGADNTLYAFDADLTVLAEQVASVIRQYQADAVFSHGSNGEYGHPAHIHLHRAVVRAVASLGEQAPLLYTANASYEGQPRPRFMNASDPADLLMDISPVREQKVAAALCHQTQNALFRRSASQEAGRPVSVPEVISTVESFHRVVPTLAHGEIPQDEVARALQR